MAHPLARPDAAARPAILGHDKIHGALVGQSDDHVERLLDQALEATFPASDPIAVSPRRRR